MLLTLGSPNQWCMSTSKIVNYEFQVCISTGYVSDTCMVRTSPHSFLFDWFEMMNMEKNILTVENFFKIFWFFIIFQLYLSLLMKIVEAVDKKSKSPNNEDNNSLKK
jgi:hypothetical protein